MIGDKKNIRKSYLKSFIFDDILIDAPYNSF